MNRHTDDLTELFCVVDADDNLREHRPRHECNANRDLLHRSVFVIVRAPGGLVFARRGHGKDTNPGMWDVGCAGHVGPGESYEAAARRELAEELGIEATLERLGRFVLDLGYEREMTTVFVASHGGPFVLNLPEVIAIGVFGPGEEPADTTPAARLVLEWVRSRLPSLG